jgi:hypothetical protein
MGQQALKTGILRYSGFFVSAKGVEFWRFCAGIFGPLILNPESFPRHVAGKGKTDNRIS